MALAVVLAFILPLRDDPWMPEAGIMDSQYWLSPIEQNAFRRIPVSDSNLSEAVALPDGETVVTVGSGGTILTTRNGGRTWQAQSSGTQNDLNGVVFAGDGQSGWAVGSGGTILTTRDGGRTWQAQISGTQSFLNSVVFTANGQSGWVVGSGGTILTTRDGGQSWRAQISGTQSFLNSVVFTTDGQSGWAVGSGGTILTTRDGGQSWQAQTSGTPGYLFSVAFAADGQSGWAVGVNGTIRTTHNGGQNWQAQTSGTQITLTSVEFSADGQTGWAVGMDGTSLMTRNGGQYWQTQSSGTQNDLSSVTFTADGQTGWAVGRGGTILTTRSSAQKWQAQASGTSSNIASVTFAADGQTGWAVGWDGAILTTRDGGQNWQAQTSGTQSFLTSVTFSPNGQSGWAVGWDGAILTTRNGGQNWQVQNIGTQADLNSIAFAADGQTGWAVGSGNTIFISHNGGENWQESTYGTQGNLYSVAFVAGGRSGWAVGWGGTVLTTHDGGQSWQAQTSGTYSDLNGVAFAADGQSGWAVGRGGTILTTSDGGQIWQAQTSGTLNNLTSVAFAADGQSGWAVGSNGTILVTLDGGRHWQVQTSGTQSYLLSVAFVADGQAGWAVGSGDTILSTRNGGQSWQTVQYRRSAPPISWLLWTAGFVILLPAFRSLSPDVVPGGTVAEILATDRPLRAGDRDVAGTDNLASQIVRFLINPQTAAPITIAVTGPWGSGKSSVLSRAKDILMAEHQRPVWFNAWHHQSEESLFAALLQAVRKQAVPSWFSLAGVEVRARLVTARIGARPVVWAATLLVLAIVVGFAWAMQWPSAVDTMQSLRSLLEGEKPLEHVPTFLVGVAWPIAIIVGVLIVVAALKDRLTSAGLDPGRMLTTAAKAVRWKDLGVQLGFRARFQDALREMTDALGQRTLTIIIDDLDRCRPEQISEILEAVNFLTDGDGCFVLLGFAREQVVSGVGLANRAIAAELNNGEDTQENRRSYANEFVRKLIQIEVPVPQFSVVSAEHLMEAATETLKPRVDRAWMPAAIAALAIMWAAGGIWAGTSLYPLTQKQWEQTKPIPEKIISVASKASEPAVNPEPPLPSISPQPAQTEAQQAVVFYPGAVSTPSGWSIAPLGLAVVLAVLAFALFRRRPKDDAGVDTEQFSTALRHWAGAAYEVRRSPREMKRLLNRLRFAAAGNDRTVPDDILVGLGVLMHAQEAGVRAFAEGGEDLHTMISNATLSPGQMVRIDVAMDPSELRKAGLSPFEPTPEQVHHFIRLWDGVVVRA